MGCNFFLRRLYLLVDKLSVGVAGLWQWWCSVSLSTTYRDRFESYAKTTYKLRYPNSSTEKYTYLYIILVGISATMCHSAEKIPAKEGCQYTRVST